MTNLLRHNNRPIEMKYSQLHSVIVHSSLFCATAKRLKLNKKWLIFSFEYAKYQKWLHALSGKKILMDVSSGGLIKIHTGRMA